ncbi:S24 family peptidase [Methylocystis rosea]|uniref:Helix-turn-helix transcriptional regulator n=1 Tax=Methylocystis rosea TaxID=173366 RepID=A0A3G8MB26_9HYPH|nr:helix-turn-helix transcriptional regulator [Methylocystis rosea]AZG78764.1 helix-turn-helix transcriptional regulator [Methylocystis rosea]
MTALSHAQIWSALDALVLAQRYSLTTSGLSRKAGLDATTFNRSKRRTADGHLRWPSTESIAKVLDATGASLDEFIALLAPSGSGAHRRLPLIDLARASGSDCFDDTGVPAGSDWDEIDLFADIDEHSYALEVSGEAMAPFYHDGDTLLVSPKAPVRRSDRVAVKTAAGEVLVKRLNRQTAHTIELESFGAGRRGDQILRAEDVIWMARILWASQ